MGIGRGGPPKLPGGLGPPDGGPAMPAAGGGGPAMPACKYATYGGTPYLNMFKHVCCTIGTP